MGRVSTRAAGEGGGRCRHQGRLPRGRRGEPALLVCCASARLAWRGGKKAGGAPWDDSQAPLPSEGPRAPGSSPLRGGGDRQGAPSHPIPSRGPPPPPARACRGRSRARAGLGQRPPRPSPARPAPRRSAPAGPILARSALLGEALRQPLDHAPDHAALLSLHRGGRGRGSARGGVGCRRRGAVEAGQALAHHRQPGRLGRGGGDERRVAGAGLVAVRRPARRRGRGRICGLTALGSWRRPARRRRGTWRRRRRHRPPPGPRRNRRAGPRSSPRIRREFS